MNEINCNALGATSDRGYDSAWDIEINDEMTFHKITSNKCEMKRCNATASKGYELKRVENPSGTWFHLCKEHDHEDNAFELYESYLESLRGE